MGRGYHCRPYTLTMHIGAIVSSLKPYGSVRRYLELGNEIINQGHRFILFTPEVNKISWFDFKGEIHDTRNIEADFILMSDSFNLKLLDNAKGTKYIWVNSDEKYQLYYYQQYWHKAPFLLCNRKLLRVFPDSILLEGGINTSHFCFKNVRVGYYETNQPTKNSQYIYNQLSALPTVELVEIYGLKNEELCDAFKKLDYFVLWETAGGWSNLGAEAISCGTPVVTNGVNCEPYISHCIVVKDLKTFFSEPLLEFDWRYVVEKLLKIFAGDTK